MESVFSRIINIYANANLRTKRAFYSRNENYSYWSDFKMAEIHIP